MKFEVKELKDKKAVIKFEDTKPYFLNALRRVMIADLPKLAIEDVIIYDNTSALFDEIISHRLGLIPIPTDLSLLNFKEECSCKGKGCPSCTVRYTLSKEGGGTVFSGDLQPAEKSWKITEDKIPIVELYGDQRLILEVEAVLGRGRNHAKWQAVTAPAYRMHADITFDSKNEKDVKDFVDKLPKDLVKVKKGKLELTDEEKLPVLESYMDEEDVDFITIKRDPTKYAFKIETDGALKAKDAIVESAKLIEDKYKEFGKQLSKLK